MTFLGKSKRVGGTWFKEGSTGNPIVLIPKSYLFLSQLSVTL